MNDNNNPNKTEGDLAENDLDQSTNQGVGRPSYRIEEVGTDGGEEKGQQEDSLGKQSIEQGVGHQQTPVNSTKVTGESTTEPQTPPANPMASVLRPEMQVEPVPIEPVLPPKRKGPPKILLVIMVALLGLTAILMVLVQGRGSESEGGEVGNKGEITWWGVEESESAIKPLIDEYQNINPNVKITYRQVAREDYRERVTNAIASGRGPDIFEIHNSWTPMFRNDVYAAPSNIITQAEIAASFYPVVTSNLTTNEGIVGLPLFYDALTLFVNEDIFSSAFREYPATWNELRDLVDPKTEGNLTLYGQDQRIVQSGIALGVTDNVDYWQDIIALMMLQNQVNMNNPSGASTRDAVIFYRLFSDVYKAWDKTLPSSVTAFTRGNVAMILAPSREAINIINSNPNLRFRTVPLPQLVKDRPDDPDVTYASYWPQVVWKRSASRDLAWDFLKFMVRPETLQKLNQTRKTSGQLEKAYPRMDMASLQQNHPLLGSVVVQAQHAKSWYLAGKTNDGASGLNSLLSSEFEKLLNSARLSDSEIEAFTPEVVRILSQYGIVR
jgi:raffinose/stachyose/melibiose transport system substrate-binding protein